MLPSSRPLGRAVAAVAAAGDRAHRAAAEVRFVGDIPQRAPAFTKLEHLGDLNLAGGERPANSVLALSGSLRYIVARKVTRDT